MLVIDTQKQIKSNLAGFDVMAIPVPKVAASVKAVARQLPKGENEDGSKVMPGEDAPDFSPVNYQAIADKPQ